MSAAGLASAAAGQDTCLRYVGQAFGERAHYVHTGDVNGDGADDILWVYNRDLGVSISTGERSFGPPVMYDAPCCGAPFAVGDFNGDGLDDVAMASDSGGSNSFRVRFAAANGSGTLGNSLGFGSPSRRDMIASADLNGDGLDDVVVSGRDLPEFRVYLGREDNSFDEQPAVPLLRGASSIEIADLDDDGDLDLVLPVRDMRRFQASLNDGLGAFGTPSEVVAGDFGPPVAVGDFTGDGVPDVLAGESDDKRWQLFRGDGAGGFVRIAQIEMGFETDWLVAAEIGGGPETDLIVKVGAGGTPGIRFFEGDGSGGFVMREEILSVPDLGVGMPAFGELTGDGEEDMLLPTTAGAAVFPGADGRPRFAGSIEAATESASADFNDDGAADVAALADGSMIFAMGNGDGTFAEAQEVALPTPAYSMDVGDVDGDGIDDVIAGSWFSGLGEVMPVISDGAGGFTLGTTLISGAQVWSVALGDISGDGVNDVVAGSRDLNAWLYFVNDGTGGFASPLIVSNLDNSSTWTVDVADFDGNGYGDVVAGMRRFGQQGSDRNSVFFNEGHGLFTEMELPGIGETDDIVAADVDGDGLEDVTVTQGETLAMLRNLGSRSFAAAERHFAGKSARAVEIADLNLDGQGDFMVSAGGGYARLSLRVSMPACGEGCVADFNQDGSVNTQDVLAFLNAWNAGEGSADINGDGSVNTQDVLAFLNLWNVGC
ncbi:MAG: FG-GAP-like repeat-containing protein [Phycisphaerales bacterium JB041]